MKDSRIVSKNEIDTPALLIDLDAFEYNIKVMADFMKDKRAKLRPHYKSYKCPTISHKQIDAGAKGITCAKLGEAETLIIAGIKDILIANQIADPVKLYRLAGLAHAHPETKITVAVDNAENITALSDAASKFRSTLYVLVEVDVGMNRCGVNTPDEVYELAKKIEDSNGLVFEGIQAYEGHLVYDLDTPPSYTEEYRREGVKKMSEKVGKIKDYIEKNGMTINEISGGGTGTYNITGDNTIWTEIQAGSYVLMDNVYDRVGLKFKCALTILAKVMHKRPGMAITDAGLKVCTTEQGPPTIKGYPYLKMHEELSEEHGLIEDPKNELKYLQRLEYIPSHGCTTVNLHDQFYCVRNDLLEAVWPITARGKSQ
jgi:D-serine deaminase-like pyridoxal phosphate-dependent protein